MSMSTLPSDFLQSPAANIKVSRIDFKKAGLPMLENCYAVVLDNVLSEEECALFIEAATASAKGGWKPAMINAGFGTQIMSLDTRRCGRIVWDSQEVADRLWGRVKNSVLDLAILDKWYSVTGRGELGRCKWEVSRLNEQMKILKYQNGDYFKEHWDANYEDATTQEISFFTIHLYLNDETTNEEGYLKGGATTFFGDTMSETYSVAPKVGRVLIFQQREVLHSGGDVDAGTKITLRSDIMYRRAGEVEQRKKELA